MTRIWIMGAAAALMLTTACDSGAQAVASAEPAGAGATAAKTDTAAADVNWAASRTRSAHEAALAQFERNGAAFGAETVIEYAQKAADFTAHPPKGAETVTRANGDVLVYDPAANVFAVATADGAPRTMFKPREGAAYWQEQKSRAAGQEG